MRRNYSVFAEVRAVRTGISGSLSSVRNGGEGWGEEALRQGDRVRMGGAPLSPALSPFVPHGARETDPLLNAAISARTFATVDMRMVSWFVSSGRGAPVPSAVGGGHTRP